MSYIDPTGRIKNRNIKGLSGKTYINPSLLKQKSPVEYAAMLEDGISIYKKPPIDPKTPRQLERERKQAIRSIVTNRIEYDLIGEGEGGDNVLLDTLVNIIEVQVLIFRALKIKGLMVNADFNPTVIEMNETLVKYRDMKRIMREGIQNNQTLDEVKILIDAIIPDPYAGETINK